MTSAAIFEDAFNLLADRDLGSGISRRAFSSELFPDKVVKCENPGGKFQNILEWETWQRIKETALARWFAPCRWISPNGLVLIQDRTTPAHRYPEKLPVFLTDTKRTNYGMLKGRFVCHDYGTNLLMENGMTKRMHKVEWWDA